MVEEVYVIGHTTKSADWLSLVTAPVLYRLKILGERPFYDRLSLSFFYQQILASFTLANILNFFLYKPHFIVNRRKLSVRLSVLFALDSRQLNWLTTSNNKDPAVCLPPYVFRACLLANISWLTRVYWTLIVSF